MELNKVLNDEQIQGVTCTSQYTKVVAGAGSGKTRVLTYRIAYLIAEKNVYPNQILGITFTNKAAKEIKERVNQLIPGANNMALSTIHSWCARFLRVFASEIDYPRNFSILDEEDQVQIMKNIFASHGLSKKDPHIKECLNWISGKKTDGFQYQDIANERFPNPLIMQYLQYFGEYTEVLKKNASLDFDDLLLKSIEILKENEEIHQRMMHRYLHILVDEFQDINDVQFHLISLLLGPDTSLYVVGDPDQTIYTWRGANNRIMLRLEENLRAFYKDATVNTILLVNNYRSTKNILNAANRLISFNKERVKKDLFAVNPDGEAITYYSARTHGEETSYVATTIKELVKEKGLKYTQFAVLYRSNYLTRELEAQLNLHQIPYKLFGGQKFYQRREIKDVIAYLTLLVNPDNDVCFERIINVPKRNIGPTSIDIIKQKANEAGQALFLFCKESLNSIELPESKKAQIRKLIYIIEVIRQALSISAVKDYAELIERYLDELAYFNFIKEEENGDERVENVKELIGTIRQFFLANPEGTFIDFISNATLQSSSDEVELGDYVSLMTVHTAKGLEFDYVFLYGFNEGVFPVKRAVEESKAKEEEERRLAYVAFTRAKKKLYITSNQDFSYVMGMALKPSRFIKEAGLQVKKQSLFDNYYDDQYINPFHNQSYREKSAPKKVTPAPSNATNGVKSWSKGDALIHDQFGAGIVVEVVSDKLIKVKFDDPEYGVKTLLGSHIKIKKLVH